MSQNDNRERNHPMKLTMRLGPRSYDIILSRGALGRLGKLANLMNRRVLVVTDDGVPARYADAVLAQCTGGGVKLVLPQGEATKSLESFAVILKKLLAEGFTRQDAVVAVGGGVVGDLAGFAAACYMRGIAFINCPTTTLSQIDSSIGGKTAVDLDGTKNIVGAFYQPEIVVIDPDIAFINCPTTTLSQIDSSIGGKTAVDLDGTKNIVGAFYQPEIVVIDPDTLETLPRRHFVNGMAEAVKAGLIGDKHLFELFETEDPGEAVEEILCRALVVKKNIVEQDEREKSLRAALNFGHTIGHAIESAQGLNGLYHGECVALGMLPMTEDPTLKKRMLAVYRKLGLPARTEYDPARVMEYLRHDKKAASGGRITVVRVPELGSFRLDKVPLEELEAIVNEGAR